jgi:hypothetical protein
MQFVGAVGEQFVDLTGGRTDPALTKKVVSCSRQMTLLHACREAELVGRCSVQVQ